MCPKKKIVKKLTCHSHYLTERAFFFFLNFLYIYIYVCARARASKFHLKKKIRYSFKFNMATWVCSTGKISDSWIRDLRFNPYLHQKSIYVLVCYKLKLSLRKILTWRHVMIIFIIGMKSYQWKYTFKKWLILRQTL